MKKHVRQKGQFVEEGNTGTNYGSGRLFVVTCTSERLSIFFLFFGLPYTALIVQTGKHEGAKWLVKPSTKEDIEVRSATY